MDPAPVRPEFHDPRLRRAFHEGAPAIEQFTARLDQLSADIKNLEAFLERSAVRMPVRVRFPHSYKDGGRRSWGDEDDSPFGDFLAWGRGEPDRYRIIYYRVVPGDDEPEEQDRCVLIEAPLEIRVRARQMLPKLLLQVSEAAKLGAEDESGKSDTGSPQSPGPSDDDIPF